MNEEQKNIETCLPEDILSEVANVPTDPQFRSLVEESFDPLQQQAAAQEGYDGYKEIVWTHKPYTFTSSVKQMKSNLILLLRRLWRFPFGRGTAASSAAGSSAASAAAPIRSLADMWQHYITRLKGNPEYGIPSRLSQLTDLPDAPALLAYRDMSSGIRFGTNPLPDGMSLVNFLCSDRNHTSSVTEIVDDNSGYDAYAHTLSKMVNLFPNLTKLTIKARRILATGSINIIPISTFEEIEAPDLEYFGNDESVLTSYFVCCLLNGTATKKVTMQKLKTIRFAQFNGYADRSAMFNGCKQLEEIDVKNLTVTRRSDFGSNESCALAANCPSLKKVHTNIEDAGSSTGGYFGGLLVNCPALEELSVGKIKYTATSYNILKDTDADSNMPNLIHLEIGEGTDVSLNFSRWIPKNALSDNLQQFLLNFRSFIVLRLSNRNSTSALTLTLSEDVYNSVTGANSGLASYYKLEKLGITDADLTDAEKAAGITTDTAYNKWLDTYRAAINWNLAQA